MLGKRPDCPGPTISHGRSMSNRGFILSQTWPRLCSAPRNKKSTRSGIGAVARRWLALSFCLVACGCMAAAEMTVSSNSPGSWPGADLFADCAVHRCDITIEASDLKSLREEPRKFVPARLAADNVGFENVALHLKGSVGSFRPIDDKPGFTLDFCRFEDGRKFHGLRRIHLNNSVEDPSFVNERLGSDMFRAAGIPTPRVSHALVRLNGRNLGLYVLNEGFTEDFLSCYFRQPGRDLFEPNDGHDVD